MKKSVLSLVNATMQQALHRFLILTVLSVLAIGAGAQTTFPVVGKPYALRANTTTELYLDPQTTTTDGNFTINTWSDKCILTFAQSTKNNGYYSIKNKNGYYAAASTPSGWNTTATQTYNSETSDWRFTLNDGKYRLTSIKKQDKYLGVDNTWATAPTYYDKNTSSSMSWTVYSVYSISISGNPSTATATIGGKSYSNGSYYLTTSQTVNASSVTPSNISEYEASVVVNDNLGTITITYQRSATPTTLAFTSNALNMTSATLSLPSVSLTAGGSSISGTVTYSSNNTGCVSVSNTGVLTINGSGTATITASFAGNTTYAASSTTMTITVANTEALNEPSTSDMTITPSSATLDLGGTATYTASSSINQITKTRPAYVSIKAGDATYYKVGDAYQASEPEITETPGEALNFTQIAWTFSGGNGNYYTPSVNTTQETNTQVLTRTEQKTGTTQTFTISATGRYGGWEGPTKTATATVTIPATQVDLTALHAGDAINIGISESESLEGHYTWEPNYDAAGAAYKKFTYTSGNTNIATVDANGKVTGIGAGTTTITIQSEKMDGTNGVSCTVTVNVSVAAPTISIDSDGNVTITPPVAGLQIRYTTNGSDPTASTGTVYNATFGPVSNETVVKAVAVSNTTPSSVASKQYITSGISGDKVILNDYEDHNWTYYSDKPDNDYPDVLRSPDPRNVKITYQGGGVSGASEVAVSATESANTFVYYETIEKNAWGSDKGRWLTGDYAYRTIRNPFSKRPASGSGTSKTYYGFNGWKIVSGGKYIGKEDGTVVGADELVNFQNFKSTVANATAAEIVFEAQWAEAEVQTSTDGKMPTFSKNYNSYERNLWVINSSDSYKISAPDKPVTVMGCYPDGTPANTATIQNATSGSAVGNVLKIENIKIGNGETPVHPYEPNTPGMKADNGSGTFTVGKAPLIVGRGCVGTVGTTKSSNSGGQYTLILESGKYYQVELMDNGGSTNANDNNWGRAIFGCDYDRAADDGHDNNGTGDNSKLRIMAYYTWTDNGACAANSTSSAEWVDITCKSGYYGFCHNKDLFSTISPDGRGLCLGGNADQAKNMDVIHTDGTTWSLTADNQKAGTVNNSFYCGGTHSFSNRAGKVRVLIEGGEFTNVNGGGYGNASTCIGPNFRVKGGWIKGALYGTASSSVTDANTRIVITGGEINGWIAGACNGTDFQNNSWVKGNNNGSTFLYIGGNAECRSHNKDGKYNNAWGMIGGVEGGNIFASGRGGNPADFGANVGTQNYNNCSYCGSSINTYLVVADKCQVEQSVYGGGYLGIAQQSHIWITGGTMGAVYGGASTPITTNADWRAKSTDIRMYGGLVKNGVYGGHYLGSDNAGAIHGNSSIAIYGGQVGTDATHTANVHGGGYGQGTRVTGNVDVTIGKENATEGATIYGDVYGGSAEGKTNGNTSWTTGATTNVTLNAGTINGSLYGGGLGTPGNNGNAADVYGPVQVTVNGGSVKGENSAVYGCNNVNGTPQSTVKVDVYKTDAHNAGSDEDDPADDVYAINAVYGGGNQANYTYTTTEQVYPQVTVHNCDNSIEYVYGGGNQATVPGTKVDIYGGNIIGNVFGGGNNANVTTNGTDVNIYGGTILNVYGGNNNGGAITGTINVDVAETKETTSSTLCPVNITDLYGGGNKAASAAGNITIGKCSNISNVYGGANQANVTGPIILDIVDGNIGTVFGGNNNSGTITGAITVNVKWNGSAKDNESDTNTRRSLGSVYGGGNKAPYTGNPTVNFTKGITTGSVFGGGLGKDAVVTGNPTVNIGDWATKDDVIIGGDVFGGGDLAAVEGDPTVTVRECGTIIEGDLYGGGNAAPVYSTNTTMWGGTVMGNVFGGGNGADSTKNANGAQVGYKSDDSTAGTGDGNAVLNVYGGTIGTWTTDSSTGVSTCQDGTGGVFGGSNTNGNIRGKVMLTLDQHDLTTAETALGATNPCPLKLNEVYGSGNEAAYAGTGITFTLGCVDTLDKIYGGAKNADMNGDIHLKITSGTFKQVFGGNNIGGKINGTIKVTVDETGCHPVIIDELYGGGNQAPYSIYGYETALDANTNKPIPLTTLPSGGTAKDSPVVNVVSCTHIGQVFGGGLGSTAVMVGNPTVNIQQIPGRYDPDDQDGSDGYSTNTANKLGTIGEVFGGGNAAKVEGDTYVNIGTETAILRADGTTSIDKKGANITGNVYGGGNQADVTGKTHVQVGPKPAN